jgi:N-acetylglucosaminyl-diphospho-decaprenol L-rhamnosyltransferase
MDMTLSTIIVSYRTPDLTECAARSALAAADDGDVIVVDNASGDATLERLGAILDPRLAVIANERNVGFGTAANVGARRAVGDVLLFLNSDATLTSEAAAELVAEVRAHGGRCLAAPRLAEPDGTIQRSVGLLPHPSDLALRGLGLHRVATWLSRLGRLRRLVATTHIAREYETAVRTSKPIDVTMMSGACFAVGREAFLELGGFDEGYFMYLEDADLCRRAAAAGFRLRYLPQASVEHIGGASSPGNYRFGPLHAAGMARYLRTWYGPGGLAVGLAILLLRAMGFTVFQPRAAGQAWRALGAAMRAAR